LGISVELRDHQGAFLATGYGNPNSLIAFRALSFEPPEINITEQNFLLKKILSAWEKRRRFDFQGSFRLCFAENDYVPGLIIDYYEIYYHGKTAQVFSYQLSTAGMQKIITDPVDLFKNLVERAYKLGFCKMDFSNTAIISRNDLTIRKMEGLDISEPQIIKNLPDYDFSKARILVDYCLRNRNKSFPMDPETTVTEKASGLTHVTPSQLHFYCDLLNGQKTGFFLDQTRNIGQVADLIRRWPAQNQTIRILDLCCYVGHWGTQLSRTLLDQGFSVEVTLVDVSKFALEFAQQNVLLNSEAEKASGKLTLQCFEMDVLRDLEKLPTHHFDIVIADPPAFIKAKKDIPTGTHAYLKLNTQAFRMAKAGGIVASCSCSGLLTEEDFREAVRKAQARNQSNAWGLGRGGHALDHPTLLQFPEGTYLKMLLHGVC